MLKSSSLQTTLLYVEDDVDIREELVDILKRKFPKLYVAKNGEDGLVKYHKYNPDIILTDIRMPIMNGLDMIKQIRKENKEISIIVSSAFNDSEYLLKAIDLDINQYLLKPINIKKLFSILESITERILTKERLIENEQILAQYKEVVDVSAIVSKSNTDGNITYVNDAFTKISGYSKEELIGANHNLVRHPDTPLSLFKNLWKTILSKKRWNGIVKNRAKDGSTYYVDSTITPILDLDNNIVEFISLRKDVTEIELQKENLKVELDSSSKTLHEKTTFIGEFEKAIKENTLFCRTSVDGLITMSSKEFCKLLGYKESELNNLNYRKLIKVIQRENIMQEIDSNIKNGKVWQGVLEHKAKNREEVYLESSFIPIVGTDNNILEVFCFFVDISESVILNREIVATQREVISTMGAIGETRSKETGAHVKRVAEYSKLLALKAGLSQEVAEELKMASPMHDIGKVAIADSILNKPGKLTNEEFEIMKTHAELGFEMLRHSNQRLLHSAAIVANEHHEKWDGSGYPNQLSGDKIHIFGRITALADVFDALGHDRVYKKAWKLEDILSLFEKEKGKHFDPNLVNIFFENLDEFLKIKNDFDNN